MIIAVAGFPGSGKTTWIHQQIEATSSPALYFSPNTQTVPIDSTRLTAQLPQIEVIQEGTEFQLIAAMEAGVDTFIELGFHLDLASVNPLLTRLGCHRVAVAASNAQAEEWQNWADEIVIGGQTSFSPSQIQNLWKAPLTGQVFESASLEIFWQELTQGAYGEVYRAKGVFDILEGQSVYGDFVAGVPSAEEFEVLNLPLWLQGRPQRFSGLEVIGKDLNEKAMIQTLQDCCLSDAMLANYQQQIRESLESQEEVLV